MRGASGLRLWLIERFLDYTLLYDVYLIERNAVAANIFIYPLDYGFVSTVE